MNAATAVPEPSAAHLLMRNRLTALRALYAMEHPARGAAVGTRVRAFAVMTAEQLAAAILDRRERSGALTPGGGAG